MADLIALLWIILLVLSVAYATWITLRPERGIRVGDVLLVGSGQHEQRVQVLAIRANMVTITPLARPLASGTALSVVQDRVVGVRDDPVNEVAIAPVMLETIALTHRLDDRSRLLRLLWTRLTEAFPGALPERD